MAKAVTTGPLASLGMTGAPRPGLIAVAAALIRRRSEADA